MKKILLGDEAYAQGVLDAGLSGYYPASHQSYQAMRALREALAAEGVRTERAAVPVKTILVDCGKNYKNTSMFRGFTNEN